MSATVAQLAALVGKLVSKSTVNNIGQIKKWAVPVVVDMLALQGIDPEIEEELLALKVTRILTLHPQFVRPFDRINLKSLHVFHELEFPARLRRGKNRK